MHLTSMPGRKRLAVGILTVFVTACGGGGGGGTLPSDAANGPPADGTPSQPARPSEPAPMMSSHVFDIEKGMNNYFMTAATYVLKATDATGHVYEITEKVTPLPNMRFTSIVTADEIRGSHRSHTISIDGKLQPADGAPFASDSSWEAYYFQLGSPFKIVGYAEFNTLKPMLQSFPMPSTAKVGESRDLVVGQEKTWINASTSEQDIVGWSLEADTAETAWLCITERVLVSVENTSWNSDIQAKRCSKITPAGTVIGAKADVIDGVNMLRFR